MSTALYYAIPIIAGVAIGCIIGWLLPERLQ
jgi:F0F1-type ATP synthase assembly protein I